MEKHNTFTTKEKFQKELLDIIDSSTDTYSRIEKLMSTELYPVNKDSYHLITRLLKPQTRAEHTLFSLLYQNIYRSETMSGGSAKIAYLFALKFLRKLIQHRDELPSSEQKLSRLFEQAWEKFRASAQDKSIRATEEDLQKQIAIACDYDKDLSTSIWEAMKLAGLEGKIFVENGKQPNYIVELKEGYSFKLNPFKFMLQNRVWDRREVKILIVDGLVEKVSEIDQLLLKAMELKQPLVILAHGFSEEVAATCKTNNDKGNFDVMPIRMPHDLNSINIVNDISVVCNTSPITHLHGQLLSCVTWDDVPVISRIKVEETTTTIENPKSRPLVSNHIRYLVSKRQSRDTVEDIRNLLDERMRCLVSHSVVIHLPNVDSIKTDAYRVKIDIALRNCKTMLNYGSISLNEVVEDYQYKREKGNLVEHCFYDTLRQVQDEINQVPTLSAVLGLLLAGKTCMMLIAASGYVEITS